VERVTQFFGDNKKLSHPSFAKEGPGEVMERAGERLYPKQPKTQKAVWNALATNATI
jgi:hypothetical protein